MAGNDDHCDAPDSGDDGRNLLDDGYDDGVLPGGDDDGDDLHVCGHPVLHDGLAV